MNFGLELVVQNLSVAAKHYPSLALVYWANHSFNPVFPPSQTQVAAINVDTAGREVPLSGQKGICVQWR
jgi:hypothetical protein